MIQRANFEDTRVGALVPYLVILFSWIYYLAYFDYGFIMNDEGFFLENVTRMLRGQLPLRDFYGYPPLRYFYLYGWMATLGTNVIIERVALLMLAVISALLMFLIARRSLPLSLALVPTMMVLIAPGPWIKTIDTLVPILNLWLLLRYLDKPSVPRLGATGIAVGLSFMSRQDLGLFSLAAEVIVLYVFGNIHDRHFDWRKFMPARAKVQRLILFFVFVGVGLLPVVLVYAASGAIPSLIRGLFTSVSVEETLGLNFFNPSYDTDWTHPLAAASKILVYLSFVILLLFPAGVFFKWRTTKCVNAEFVAIWLLACAAYPVTFLLPLFTRITQTVPLGYLLGTIGAVWIVNWVKSRVAAGTLNARVVVGLTSLALVAIPLSFLFIVLVNNNIFIGSIAIRIGRPVRWEYARAPIYESVENTGPINEVVARILADTRPEQPIFASFDRGFYFLTERRDPTSVYFLPEYLSSAPDVRQQFLSELEQNPPQVLIRRVEEVDDPASNPAWWSIYLTQHYALKLQNTAYALYEPIGQ